MNQYLLPIVALLSMLAKSRNQDIYHIPLPVDIYHMMDSLCINFKVLTEEEALEKIHRILLTIWSIKWIRTQENNIPDPTERCLVLLALRKDGAFKKANEVTSIIAKFQYCMRLVFIKEIKNKIELEGTTEDEACTSLQAYFTEKTNFTFSRLCSLQHRASSAAYSTMGVPHIWWSDTIAWKSMVYKGNTIHFSDVCKIFTDLEARLVDQWENKVLMGKKLRVAYDFLADDLTNNSLGYSFMEDERNKHLVNKGLLLKEFLTDPAICSYFTVSYGDNIVWNKDSLRGWLADYAKLHGLLLLRTEMLSGAPARGTELTAMTYRNTFTRSLRNLIILGEHIVLLCLYQKTSAITGQDKLIPHSLDAVTGDILIQDLMMARTFAELAVHICFPNNKNIKELYHNFIFISHQKLFSTDDLSATMSQHALPFIHYSLTISSWRHIQTAWKRKFRCSVDELIDDDRRDNVEALQAGHSRATENQIYGLSSHALAGAAEDILPLFLNASITWQTQCGVRPGGKFWPYNYTSSAIGVTTGDPQSADTAQSSVAHTHTTQVLQPMAEEITNNVMEQLSPMITNLIQEAIRNALTSASYMSHMQLLIQQQLQLKTRDETQMQLQSSLSVIEGSDHNDSDSDSDN